MRHSLPLLALAAICFAPDDATAGDPPAGAGDPPAGAGDPPAGAGDDNPFAWFGDEPDDDERQYLEAKGFKSARALLKSGRAAEKMIRGDKISGPPEDAEKHGEWLKETGLAKRLGIPDEPAGYGIERPEFDEAVRDFVQFDDARHEKFLGKAHELNLTPAQAKGLLEFYAGEITGDVTAAAEAATADATEMDAALKRDWGDAYEQNLTAALEVAGEEGLDDSQIEALRTGRVVGSATLAKILHELATLRGNDTLKGGGKGGGVQTMEQAQAALDEFKAKNSDALLKHDHPEHATAFARLQELKRAAGRGSDARR